MNENWSRYVQGINTLYLSRKLRFDDMFSDQFIKSFSLDREKKIRILEIGCGPGALAGALHRWYPNAEITGLDLDTAFIEFARQNEKGVAFMEGDATRLPFEDETFDVTISNTVSEHIEPKAFFGEQKRILKKGGVCLVLSARKGYRQKSEFEGKTEFEEDFWQRVSQFDDSMERFNVGKYGMNEQTLPKTMERFGFEHVSTAYAVSNLTPDNEFIPKDMAISMINASRHNDLDAIQSVSDTMPERVTREEIDKMTLLTNRKYDLRIKKYLSGEKEWDTTVSITMITRAIKGEKA
ncbi:MAG: class I SAM-dependent methyltransferase [Clostridia bacterium]|nr:class I SAM-dependent methyltransferase [Clostridia bacterium]